jgi:hypothetical protein
MTIKYLYYYELSLCYLVNTWSVLDYLLPEL